MDLRQYLLLKLSEECSEVSQRCSKQIQFGAAEVQDGQPETNRDRLSGEVRDLICIVKMLTEIGELEQAHPTVGQYCQKVDKINEYYDYSKSLGHVQ